MMNSRTLVTAVMGAVLLTTGLGSCHPGDSRAAASGQASSQAAPRAKVPFPSPESTGIRSGTKLRPWKGAFSSSSARLPQVVRNGHRYKVIDGYSFDMGGSGGYFSVDDPYVIIRNSRFTTSGEVSNTGAVLQGSGEENKGLIVEDSEFDGGPRFQRGVQSDSGDLAVVHSRFHNTGESAIEKNDRSSRSSLIVAESYLTNDKGWPRGQHVDGIQVGGAKNVVIHNNTVLNQPYGGADGDTSYVSNSALGLWAELGNVSGIVMVDRNLLSGGGRTIYIEQKAPFRWEGPVDIVHNTFDTRFSPKSAVWGPLYPARLPNELTWSGNEFKDGRALSLKAALQNYP